MDVRPPVSVLLDIDNLLRLLVGEVAVRRHHRRVWLPSNGDHEGVDAIQMRSLRFEWDDHD